ncbi:hypothetical protein PG985_001016 [Apiospora marii]|uniref:Uncharacterized protein n=1 Tax=Apiospora marii TaxID=335849 RepID=A0ABR1RHQ9_9PEZI
MREELADILLECGALNTDQEARETLKGLLEEEVGRSEQQRDETRRCSLYHKLCVVYLRPDNAKQASLMLRRAFDGRRAMVPTMHGDLKDTSEALVKALQHGTFASGGGEGGAGGRRRAGSKEHRGDAEDQHCATARQLRGGPEQARQHGANGLRCGQGCRAGGGRDQEDPEQGRQAPLQFGGPGKHKPELRVQPDRTG